MNFCAARATTGHLFAEPLSPCYTQNMPRFQPLTITDNSILKAILVDVVPPEMDKDEATERLDELESLVSTFGGIVVVRKVQKRDKPHYETFIGQGKLNEVLEDAKEIGAKLVIVNNQLKPKQTYALSEFFRPFEIEVWDRIDLILKIFAKHAQSTEARLQIELASIKHMGPRIFGMGMELSRQGATGSSGSTASRGIGETNTEIMKRHLRKQEERITEKLKHYEIVREGHRKRRRRQNFKTVALVGYTNVGKTTILNKLTHKGAYAANKLFATLDTRVGKLWLPGKQEEILMSDTIGFIQDLPPELIKAFKSTLDESIEADLLLHVIDIGSFNVENQIAVVEDILQQLGAGDKPKIYVFNKIDNCVKRKEERMAKKYAKFKPVFVAAERGIYLDQLVKRLEEVL